MKVKFEENIFKGKILGFFFYSYFTLLASIYSDSEPIVGLGLFLLKHQFMCNYF